MTWNSRMYPMVVLGALGLVVAAVLPFWTAFVFLCGTVFGCLFSVAAVVSVPDWREELRGEDQGA